MPAILDDPASPTIYRLSGDAPYPDPANPAVPPTILPRHVTLRDRQTVATVVPFASRHEVPESLLRYLSDQFNKEIEGGDTYPMLEPLSFDKFASYWFQNFGGIMLLGHIESAAEVAEGKDWSKECLGTFYIKPNYPGRSSHICNAGFIVTDASRNRGVGRLMGETYLDWAPKLGYKYSVFNLVYETNVASCKIWDALGFKRIGRVKGAGNLKSHPDRLVDAIIYGRDLGDAAGGAGGEELVSEERFDKIKFYLKYGRYPNGADRAEKSRLRSAATHYKLLDGDVLMLKDKEVISDPQRQYDIARSIHSQTHGGINKTTATIAERYHWSRIKETVSDVIRNCAECKETTKATSSQTQQPSPGLPVNGLKRPNLSPTSAPASKRASPSPLVPGLGIDYIAGGPRSSVADPSHLSSFALPSHHQFADPDTISILPPAAQALPSPTDATMTQHDAMARNTHNPMLQDTSHGPLHSHHASPSAHLLNLRALAAHPHGPPAPDYQPIDPQIIEQPSVAQHNPHIHTSLHHHSHHYEFSQPSPPHHPHTHHDPDSDAADAETFHALINAAATDDDDHEAGHGLGVAAHTTTAAAAATAAPGTTDMTTPTPKCSHPSAPHHYHQHHHQHHHQHEPAFRSGDAIMHSIHESPRPGQLGGAVTAITASLPTAEEQDHQDDGGVDRDLDLEMLIESPGNHHDDDGHEDAVLAAQHQRKPDPGGRRSMDVDMSVGVSPGDKVSGGNGAGGGGGGGGGRMDVAGLLTVDDEESGG